MHPLTSTTFGGPLLCQNSRLALDAMRPGKRSPPCYLARYLHLSARTFSQAPERLLAAGAVGPLGRGGGAAGSGVPSSHTPHRQCYSAAAGPWTVSYKARCLEAVGE